MEDYYVAPSYVNLATVGDVFEKNGKHYIKVILKSGKEKEVRAYEAKEEKSSIDFNRVTHVFYDEYKELGFKPKGYIYVVRGDEKKLSGVCKIDKRFGWYLPCTSDLTELPMGCSIKRVPWVSVCSHKITRLDEDEIVIKKVNDFFKRVKKEV